MTAGAVPPYARGRADYGGTQPDPAPQGGVVTAVRPESPAWDAGLEPGMVVTHAAGKMLTDMVAWLWEADGESVDITVCDPRDGTVAQTTLERLPGEDWGIEFEGAVFDGMRTCRNACVFCFMQMLPPHMRRSLYIRDDDYRLSFLQGNFVTLTNLTDEDVQTIIERQMSPMNVSLHAVSPDVRERLIGRNAARGIEALEQLIAGGIEIHAQIVLCPDLNDGEELDRTLAWCAARPEIASLGIVPMGYTRFQKRFSSSFSDDPARARRVVEQVRPYQERMRCERGRTVFTLSDEFYLDAGLEVPEAAWYDGYPQFYDGIGMIRSYIDETDRILQDESERVSALRDRIAHQGLSLVVISGEAAASTVARLVEGGLGGTVRAIRNDYFGGNVDVTGLICAGDLLAQLDEHLAGVMLILPDIMFNADGLTLDGYHLDQLTDTLTRRGATVRVTSTQPADLLEALEG